ncbi:alpha/beta fold hydrolase [Candidatus Chlorohelix sp.]|uniref:alpha/beta hydrolase n=1 Tax=Candidatus Chlorohelix sp. TaxID=3139201 RepID=UPI003054BDBA
MKLEIISQIPENPKSPPLLFIHGAMHGAWCWSEYFVPFFAQAGYPSYALSFRGHGNSEGQIEGTTLRDYLEDIRQVAEQLPEPPIMVAHSLGAFLILKYIEKYPIKGAIMVSPTFSFPLYMRIPGVILGKPAYPFIKNRKVPAPKNTETVRRMFFSQQLPEEQLQHYTSQMCDGSMLGFMGLLWEKPPKAASARQVPLFFQVNATDTMRKFMPDDKFAKLYGAERRVYYGTAHNMMLEVNWREVAEDGLNWLKKHFPQR